MVNVVVNGKQRQEMHVDGGTTDNAILLPIETNLNGIVGARNRRIKRRLFVIVNSHVNPEFKKVRASTVDIAGRSILTLIKQQTIGDVFKLFGFAQKNKIAFNLATVPDEFNEKSSEAFDREYMTKLFNRGEELGRAGYKWQKTPPLR